MKSSIDLISEQKERNISIKEDILRLQKKLSNSDLYLAKKLSNHFISSDELLNTELLSDSLDQSQITKVIVDVIKTRGLKEEEYSENTFMYLERLSEKNVKDVYENLEKDFLGFSDSMKLKFSMFCSVSTNLSSKYKFSHDYILEKYNFQEYSLNKSSYVGLSGYDYEKSQALIRIAMKKDDNDGSEKIAKILTSILKLNIYKNDIIEIFESTLSEYEYIKILIEKDSDDNLYPVVCNGRYDEHKFKDGTLEERMIDAVKYIAKRHAYFGVEEELEDEYDC
jgi:hypothetical protein